MNINPSIGALEFQSIAQGINLANEISKIAPVEVIAFQTICPGRFFFTISGDAEAVRTAVQYGMNVGQKQVLDHFMIPNISLPIIQGLRYHYDTVESIDSIGVLETKTLCSGLLSIDAALKAGSVQLLKLKLAQTIRGKFLAVVSGSTSSVDFAMQQAQIAAAEELINAATIPSFQQELLPWLKKL